MCLRPIAIAIALLITVPSFGVTVFHIGNSHTWDSGPIKVQNMANEAGLVHTAGHHIRCSRGLEYIWNNPTETCVSPVPATFTDALTNGQWTDVVLQPFNGSGETMKNDEDRMIDFIDLTRENNRNSETRFWIFASWPQRKATSEAFLNDWYGAVSNGDSQATVRRLAYYENLLDRVQLRTDAEVSIIPVGEVFASILEDVDAGLFIPGFNGVGQFYRDETHMSALGQGIASATVLSAIHGVDPNDLTFTSSIPDEMEPFIMPLIQPAIASFVPEPSVLPLLLIGSLICASRRRSDFG